MKTLISYKSMFIFMPTRKLQMIGGNTELKKQRQAYIAVPMSWVRENKLKQGDLIDVEIDSESNRIIIKILGEND